MAKGFLHTGEAVLGERGDFDKLPDATYAVSGIKRFISKDEAGEPVFSLDKRGQLKLSFEFDVVGQETGLACSLTAPDFYAMALLFGADLKSVTAKNRLHSATIQKITEQINKSSKTIQVTSKGGWVNFVRNAQPPEGLYTIQFSDVRRPDRGEGLEFQPGEYGSSLVFEFKIAGDGVGRPTVWDDALIITYLNDPFVDSYIKRVEAGTDEDGNPIFVDETVTAMDLGQPLFESEPSKDGQRHATKTALRWTRFIEFFAPEIEEHVWQTDASRSQWDVNELASPQYVVAGYAKEGMRKAVALYQMRKNKRAIDLLELPSFNSVIEEEDSPMALDDLIRFITTSAGEDVFEDITPADGVFVFTDKGKTWAKDVMQPAWDAAGLGKKKALHLMDENEITALLEELNPAGETW